MNYVSQENLDNIVKGLSNKIAMSVSNGALIGDTTPVGTVISFMGTQAPLFYLVCDGTTYNIAEYQELADFIEAQFGAVDYFGGDGVTTFAVPDLRGEFLRGTGTNSHSGQGNGDSVGTHQDGSIVNGVTANSSHICASQFLDWTSQTSDNVKADSYVSSSYFTNVPNVENLQLAGQNMGHYTIRPTNTSVLYCIKYTKAVIPSEYEDGTPVGRVIFDSILREGYIKANGAQIEDATIAIPRLLSFVQKYSSQLIAPDQATYEANVGLYMYDSNNDILTLPNYIGRFMEGGNSVESIEAGLPNITGFVPCGIVFNNWGAAQGAISYTSIVADSSVMTNPVSNAYIGYGTLDASSQSSLYSNSVTTVQPPTIKTIPQIRY